MVTFTTHFSKSYVQCSVFCTIQWTSWGNPDPLKLTIYRTTTFKTTFTVLDSMCTAICLCRNSPKPERSSSMNLALDARSLLSCGIGEVGYGYPLPPMAGRHMSIIERSGQAMAAWSSITGKKGKKKKKMTLMLSPAWLMTFFHFWVGLSMYAISKLAWWEIKELWRLLPAFEGKHLQQT